MCISCQMVLLTITYDHLRGSTEIPMVWAIFLLTPADLSSSRVKPRPRRCFTLYLSVGHRITGRRVLTGLGATCKRTDWVVFYYGSKSEDQDGAPACVFLTPWQNRTSPLPVWPSRHVLLSCGFSWQAGWTSTWHSAASPCGSAHSAPFGSVLPASWLFRSEKDIQSSVERVRAYSNITAEQSICIQSTLFRAEWPEQV